LLDAAEKANLSMLESKVLKIIAEKGGKLSIVNANTLCEGDALSAFKRAKPKMKKQGWELHQHNNHLCAKPHKKGRE
jgi:hypothetical protein